jgi:hypothetical protein
MRLDLRTDRGFEFGMTLSPQQCNERPQIEGSGCRRWLRLRSRLATAFLELPAAAATARVVSTNFANHIQRVSLGRGAFGMDMAL